MFLCDILLRRTALFLIRLYQFSLSPFLGGSCRFKVSCSDFGIWSLKNHSFPRGLFFLLKRIASCHPYSSCEREAADHL
ncbi:MAG: membrane protein insertion efficiency factor YidD [Deltaproteobacteria bacterium]|nr:membrane protein insertion efficiency factor YidD [Deltaproteobacteria bacterium]MBI2500202.1 membrane protein insertion efficiency factor YidD [Deltaproteobacteria bacterium]